MDEVKTIVTEAKKQSAMTEVLLKLLALKKDSLYAEDIDKVLSWIQRGTGGEYVSLEEWLESKPNEMALKVVAKWLQNGDITPFEDEQEKEAEPECHSLSEEAAMNGSYKRFSMGGNWTRSDCSAVKVSDTSRSW